jgi:biopolymer transport protein ExbD
MAEIDSGGGGGKKKGPKKQSTKVDMTPMVDLAFLLITFFMLTTTFNKPQIMEVNMPDKNNEGKDLKINFKRALTVVLGKEDKVYFYQGVENPEVKITDYSDGGLRKVLLDKKREIRQTTGKDMFVVIKATDKSNYKNVVDVLDEMAITSAPTYALADITPADLDLLKKNGLE